jgi:hypothetical protein
MPRQAKCLFRNTLLANQVDSILCEPPGMIAKYKFFENNTLAIRALKKINPGATYNLLFFNTLPAKY